MIGLHLLKHHHRSRKRPTRVGRGPGSGTGKTSGRGHKGQNARGPGPRPGFEGGQMPLIRTAPKRGFSARSQARYQVVNLSRLKTASKEDVVDVKWLFDRRIIRKSKEPIKILGVGKLDKALTIKAHAFSRSAEKGILAAGGTAQVVK